PIDNSQANVYQIYPQADEPHSCCVTKLLQWIEWVQQHENWSLQADDYLFPEHYKDGYIQLDQSFSVTQLSTLLNKYATNAGIMDHRYNRLDTHCFRRGGAQYRLNHAQDPWPLKAIKWWGGWSETEPAEKILEYLFDDSQYEAGFGDMMSPCRHGTHGQSGVAKVPVEMMVTRECFKSTIRSMESRHATSLTKIEKEVQGLRRQISAISQQLESIVHIVASRVPENTASRIPDDHSSQVPDDRASQVPGDHASRVPDTLDRSSQQPVLSRHPLPRPSERPQREQPQYQPLQQSPPEPSQQKRTRRHPVRKSTPQRPPPRPKKPQERHPRPSSSQYLTTPIPAIRHWKDAIKQWEHGDPAKGLVLPLYEWPLEMRVNLITYSNRKTIFEEFEAFGRSEAKMRKVYGKNMEGPVDRLLRAIRTRRKLLKKGVEFELSNEDKVSEGEEDEDAERDDAEEDQHQEGRIDHGNNVPALPIPKVFHWRDVIRQWDEGDPDNGLTVPLSKWSMAMRRRNLLYPHRRAIVREYELCGRDEAKMRQVYGANMDRVNSLLLAIRKKRHRQMGRTKTVPIEPQTFDDSEGNSEEVQEEASNDPLPTVPRVTGWRHAVEQWEKGDPEKGLTPIRDWPESWREYTARTRLLYICRRRIAEEFAFCGRDESKMRKLHGKAMKSLGTLLASIRRRRKQSREQETVEASSDATSSEEEADELEEEEEEEVDELEEEEEEEEEDEDVPDGPLLVIPRIKNWKQAVEQWEKGDPERRLMPIRDWPVEWQPQNGNYSTYIRRKSIAEEFEFCGRDEARMRQLHGKDMDRNDTLLVSIRRRRKQWRQSQEEVALGEVLVKDEEDEPLIRKRRVTFGDKDSQTSSKKNRP
ncbi:hypothetical protein CPB97_006380, partial [Podila verticillata]